MKKIALPSVLLFLVSFLMSSRIIRAQTDVINATIRLSICGDNIAEVPEDCDNSDLNFQTCQSLGYDSGTLSCDIGCSFNKTLCVSTVSTPTPTPVVSPTPTTTLSSETTSTQTPVVILTQIIESGNDLVDKTFFIPKTLLDHYVDENRAIKGVNTFETVKIWVDSWKETSSIFLESDAPIDPAELITKEKCDINTDNSCNLVDLSILLYYIDK